MLLFNRDLLEILISRLNYIQSLQDADLNTEASLKYYIERDLKWFSNIVSFIENSKIEKRRVDFLKYGDDVKLSLLNSLGIRCSISDIQKVHSIKQPRNKFFFSLFRSIFYTLKSFPVITPILQKFKSSILLSNILFIEKSHKEHEFRNFIIQHFGEKITLLEQRISLIQEIDISNNEI